MLLIFEWKIFVMLNGRINKYFLILETIYTGYISNINIQTEIIIQRKNKIIVYQICVPGITKKKMIDEM